MILNANDFEEISLKDAARELRVSYSTCWRWATVGLRGIRLGSVLIGARRFTTRHFVDQFLAKTNEHNELPAIAAAGSMEAPQ